MRVLGNSSHRRNRGRTGEVLARALVHRLHFQIGHDR
jgi:hypothetical protein